IPPLCAPNAPQTLTQPSSTEHCVAQAGIRLADKASAIGTEPGIVAVLSPESAAWMVKLKVPALVGVPETVPSDPIDRPLGNAPVTTDHVYGWTPPVAARATGA